MFKIAEMMDMLKEIGPRWINQIPSMKLILQIREDIRSEVYAQCPDFYHRIRVYDDEIYTSSEFAQDFEGILQLLPILMNLESYQWYIFYIDGVAVGSVCFEFYNTDNHYGYRILTEALPSEDRNFAADYFVLDSIDIA